MPSTGESWRLGRRATLDGLRGIAILLVLAAHFHVRWVADYGKTGVSVFFALSGFLITALLLEEHGSSSTIRVGRFYRRRALRLMPAQLVCVAVVAAVGIPLGASYLTPGGALVAATYTQNLLPRADLLSHFWTLATEEQFYLLFAPCLLFLLRFPRRLAMAAVLLGAALASSVAAFAPPYAGLSLGSGEATDVTGLACSAAVLLMGCVLAFVMSDRPEGRARPGLTVLSVLGMALVAVCPWDFSGDSSAPYLASLAAGLLAVVAIYASAQGRPGWLAFRPLALVGRRSYGLYLWHYPVMILVFSVVQRSLVTSVLVALPIAVLATELSWRAVESPCLRIRDRLRREVQPADRWVAAA